MEYNDNVNYTPDNTVSDVVFRPEVTLAVLWPITDKNTLSLHGGGGYAAYVENPGLSRFYLTPGTELSFDLYVGDFWINFHDRLTVTEDAYQDPTLVGVGNYSRLENALGISALWDLNKVILQVGYDHANYGSITSHSPQPDGESDLFTGSAGYTIQPGMLVGAEVGGGFVHYTGPNAVFSDAVQWNAGGFYDTQVSPYFHCRANVGYTVYEPQNGTGLPQGGQFSGFYADIAITHRVNQFLNYTLDGGRSINYTFYGGTVDLYHAALSMNWKLLRKTAINTTFVFEHGTQLLPFSEVFDRFGPSLTFTRPLTRKLNMSLGDQFYWRSSDLPGRDYLVNILSFWVRYTF
jgi:hypothetical protein